MNANMNSNKMKLNKHAFVGLIIYPFFLIVLGLIYYKQYKFSTSNLVFFLIGHYITNISVGVGLHRLWSHRSYKTNKFVEFILCMLSTGALQGPVIAWASDHYKHHTYTDGDLDPHTPKKYSNKIKGFLWSHIGWMLFHDFDNKIIDKVTMKSLGKNKILMWQLKNYWPLVLFMQTIPPFLLGYIWNFNLLDGYASFLFIGLGRCFQQHMTFCVNSVCHFWGNKKYTNGTARDIWWLGLLLLGENWHNFHHAFPNDYRNGVKWYHLDVHKWIIYGMYKLGLAWDLERTPDFRINAKAAEAERKMLDELQTEWCAVHNMYGSLRANLSSKLSELENCSPNFKNAVLTSLNELNFKVDKLISEIKFFIESPELSSQKVLNSAYKNFRQIQMKFDDIAQKLMIA